MHSQRTLGKLYGDRGVIHYTPLRRFRGVIVSGVCVVGGLGLRGFYK